MHPPGCSSLCDQNLNSGAIVCLFDVNLYTSLKSVRLYIKIGGGGDTEGGTHIHIYM